MSRAVGSEPRGPATLEEIETRDAGRRLDVVARDGLPHAAFWLGVLFLLLGIAYAALLPRPVAPVMGTAALAAGTLLLALRLALKWWKIPLGLAHPLSAAMIGLALLQSLLHLGLTGDLHRTTGVMLTLVGAAVLLVSTPWFAAVVVAAVGGWAAVAAGMGPSQLLMYYAIGVTAAASLAVVSHGVRLHSLRRIELSLLAELDREEEMNRVFALSQDLLCIVDTGGKITRANPAFARAVGRPVGGLVRTSILDLMHPEDREAVHERLRALASGAAHVAVENRILARDGEVRWILWDAVPLPGGALIFASGRDITIRKRMEEQLRLSSVAVESAANAVVITDRAGAITWVNPAFGRLTGYTSQEVLGQNPRFQKSGKHEPAFYEELWRTISAGMVWHGETVNRRRDGSLYTEEQTIAPVRDTRGEITHFVAVKDDVTQRKRAEEVLRENERLMRREMELAAEVQSGLLPRSFPLLAGFEIAARARAARFVSGDLYDWVMLDEESCLFIMADISGKGVSAAMLSAACRTLARSFASRGVRPGGLLMDLNRALYEELSRVGVFITFFALVLDSRRGMASYASAGHTQALLARGGISGCELLGATGLPLGVLEDAEMEEARITLEPGDTLLVYSDGVTEAASVRDELFGMERLVRAVEEQTSGGAQAILEHVAAEVDAFSRGQPPSDDLTLLSIGAVEHTYPFRCAALPAALPEALGVVREVAIRYGGRFSYDTELVASELLTNIAMHAYHGKGGEIRGQITALPGAVRIETWDDGEPFDLAQAPDVELSRPHEGGYGLHVIRQLATELEHAAGRERGNHWRVTRVRGGGREARPDAPGGENHA